VVGASVDPLIQGAQLATCENRQLPFYLGAQPDWLHRILMRRIVNMVDRRGGFTDDQYGFRRDRGTEQCIAQLAMLLEARIMQGATAAERRTFAVFLDVKAAFPTLWRELTLFALGIRGKLFAYLYCCPLFNGMMSLKCGLEPLA
jgi:hypothetical protein